MAVAVVVVAAVRDVVVWVRTKVVVKAGAEGSQEQVTEVAASAAPTGAASAAPEVAAKAVEAMVG